jgi:carboxyl-terminal processing protease
MKTLILLTAIFALVGQTLGQTATAVKPVPELTSARQETFDKVWNTINEKHFDATFGGVDWAKARETYLPKAQAAKSDEQFHTILREMLGELKQSHFGVFPPPPDTSGGSAGGEIGVEIVWLDGVPVISRVEKGSPAETAGLRPGFVITKIDGKPIEERLKPLGEYLAKRAEPEKSRRVAYERVTESMTFGKAETPVKIEYRGEGDAVKTVDVVRKPFSGEMSPPLGTFPGQKLAFESRLLPNNIGYIRFNAWAVPQMPKIRSAIREYAKADGIVFDIRGNPGGIAGLATGVMGLISDKQTSLGSMTSRTGTLNLIGYPQTEPYLGKVAVLVDHGSGSTSEIFAAGLQDLGRAKIVGETSAGAILVSFIEKLPTGYLFQYAIMDYKSPKNVLIVGRGVKPDVTAAQTRAALLAGRDAQLEAAIDSILK